MLRSQSHKAKSLFTGESTASVDVLEKRTEWFRCQHERLNASTKSDGCTEVAMRQRRETSDATAITSSRFADCECRSR